MIVIWKVLVKTDKGQKKNCLIFFRGPRYLFKKLGHQDQVALLNIECSIIWQFPWIKIMNNLVK